MGDEVTEGDPQGTKTILTSHALHRPFNCLKMASMSCIIFPRNIMLTRSVVSWIFLSGLFAERYNIFCFPYIWDFPWIPWSFKDVKDCFCDDISQLSQHPQIHLPMSHKVVLVWFVQMVPHLTLLYCLCMAICHCFLTEFWGLALLVKKARYLSRVCAIFN